jgi:hypothetical protein
MFDADCQSGIWYALNSKHLKLVCQKDFWMKTTEFRKPTNQDAKFAQIISYGNLISNCPKRLGKLTGATA